MSVWDDVVGQEAAVAALQAAVADPAAMTHAWLITDENDKAWYVYSPDAQPRTVEIVAPEKKH